MLAVMLVASVGVGGWYVIHGKLQDAYIFIFYGVFAVCFAVALYTYGLLSTVSFGEGGISIRYGPFRRAHIEYADIDRAQTVFEWGTQQKPGKVGSRSPKDKQKASTS